MLAEISCQIVFVDLASAQTALTYLADKGGMARRFVETAMVSPSRDEWGVIQPEGPVILDYSVNLNSTATRDLIITQLKKYRTTLAAKVLAGSSGFIQTHDCYHDEGKPCDAASLQRFEWGPQEP